MGTSILELYAKAGLSFLPFAEKHLHKSDTFKALHTFASYQPNVSAEMEEDLKKAMSIDLTKVTDKELRVLYYIYYALYHYLFSFKSENPKEHFQKAVRLLDFCVKEFDDRIISSSKAIVYMLMCMCYNHLFDYQKKEHYALKTIEYLSFDYLLDSYTISVLMRSYFMSGCLSELKFNIKNYTIKDKIIKKSLQKEIYLAEFYDASFRGDLEKVEYFMGLIDLKSLTTFFQKALAFYYLVKGNWDRDKWKNVSLSEEDLSWANALKALHSNDTSKAIELSKKMGSNNNNLHNHPWSLNAELASGNLSNSIKLYENSKHIFISPTFNHFFLFRIELLKRNFKKAAIHYYKLIEIGRKNDSLGHVAFHLSLAAEISKEDLFRMSTFQVTKKELERVSETYLLIKRNDHSEPLARSEASKKINASILKYADLPLPVLITGETGVGKEVVAKELHMNSKRKKHDFIPINCGAIPNTLLQSELFGHVAGAFTGARNSKKGVFELAGEGTVLLDEFGETSELLQVSLLRVLQENEVRPVGSAKAHPIKCRILVTTNSNLEKLVDEGKFRQDLFYRINSLEIYIPPLRERPSDILPLTYQFLEYGEIPEEQIENKMTLSESLKNHLTDYSWPGNIRELKNKIETMRVLNFGKYSFDLDDYPSGDLKKTTDKSKLKRSQKEKDLDSLTQIRKNQTIRGKRLERIKEIFRSSDKVYRVQITELLGVTPKTITSDLKLLMDEKVIKKIEPTLSPRSHYFKII